MGGTEFDLSQIPLMTKAQEGTLAELLPAVMGMISGFPLGEAYQPGAYNVRTFPEFSMEHIVKKNGDKDGGDVITKDQLTDPNKKIAEEKLRRDIIRKEDRDIREPGEAINIKKNIDLRSHESVLGSILKPGLYESPPGLLPTSIPGMGGGGMPMLSPVAKLPSTGGGKGGTPESQAINPTQQALTQPIISPFTQGMTGNYPRRRI